MFKYSLSVNIGDGYTSHTYHFQSKSGNYSIEFLAGIIQDATDLRLIPPTKALRSRQSPEERDCDTCKHDGQCYVTMLKCKGYSPQ